jgi:hypothetical protein
MTDPRTKKIILALVLAILTMTIVVVVAAYLEKTKVSGENYTLPIHTKEEAILGDDIVNYAQIVDQHNKSVEKSDRGVRVMFEKYIPNVLKPKPEVQNGTKLESDPDLESFKISHFVSKTPYRAAVAAIQKASKREEETIIIPFGRMLKCELVNAIDSTNVSTPIVGLVMEDLWIDGRVVIPAGSEVHGTATSDKSRDRICSHDKWVIVFPKNCKHWGRKSISIKSVVLDREDKTGEGKTFGITDGSYGIRGYRIQSTEMDELKIFAAAFLEAALAGFEKTAPVGVSGSIQTIPNASNAALSGAGAVMNEYIQMIKGQMAEKGFYIRVPGGKQFYLYIQEEIALAEEGGMLRILTPEEQSVDVALHEAKNLLAGEVTL